MNQVFTRTATISEANRNPVEPIRQLEHYPPTASIAENAQGKSAVHPSYQVIFESCLNLLHFTEEARHVSDFICNTHNRSLSAEEAQPPSPEWIYREIVGAVCVRYKNAIRNCARSFMHNEDDVLDIVQIVSLKIFKDLRHFKATNNARLLTWIRKITKNELVDAKRKANVRPVTSPMEENVLKVLDFSTYKKFRNRHPTREIFLEKTLSILAPRDRLLLEMLYRDGYTCQEIANLLGTTHGAVKSRIFHARKAVKEHMERVDHTYETKRKLLAKKPAKAKAAAASA